MPQDFVSALLSYGALKYLDYLNHPLLFNSKNSVLDFGGKLSGPSLAGDNPVLFKPLSPPLSTDTRLVLEYGECSAGFSREAGSGRTAYESSLLRENGIIEEEFEKTVERAEEVLRPLRGAVARSNLYLLLLVAIGLVFVTVMGTVLGKYVSYYGSLGVIAAYVATLGIFVLCQKKKNAGLLIYAHLALALFLRSENNRLYLSHKVLLRPGHLAKWIEFHMFPSSRQNTLNHV